MSKNLLTLLCLLICTTAFNQTYYPLNGLASEKTINWSDQSLISSNNDWSTVPYLKGFRGDGLTASPDVDPRTVTSDGGATPVVIAANETTNPSSNTNDGFAEFQSIANPTIAFRASNTANAPFLMFYINTQSPDPGYVPYIDFTLRDLDGSTNNSVAQISVQYRVGETGPFITASESFYVLSPTLDFFTGYHPDLTTGPLQANHRATCEFNFPPECLNQPKVQVRIMITNSSGGNEWIGIDDIILGGSETIKIRYTNFAAVSQNNAVLLNWSAGTESIGEHFEVERSANGIQYQKLASAYAKGVGEFDYNYTDAAPLKGNAFYRLKLFHLDGSFSYTHVVKVKWSTKDIYISSLFPTVATSSVNLQISANSPYDAQLQVVSVNGTTIKKQAINLTSGNNNIPVDVSKLTPGNYFIRLKVNGENLTERFIKQ